MSRTGNSVGDDQVRTEETDSIFKAKKTKTKIELEEMIRKIKSEEMKPKIMVEDMKIKIKFEQVDTGNHEAAASKVRDENRKRKASDEDSDSDGLFITEEEETRIRDSNEEAESAPISDAIGIPSRRLPIQKQRVPVQTQRVIKPPRKPTNGFRKYDTHHYRLYDATTRNQGTAVLSAFTKFSRYDDYALYINLDLKETELDKIPHSGVRLDDLTVSKALLNLDYDILHARWPADFDMWGMVRARRVPLGRASKKWVEVGEKDVNDTTVTRAGWYYLSWGGLHTLMGKEGLDKDRYIVRPSWETFKCQGLGFNIVDWAEV